MSHILRDWPSDSSKGRYATGEPLVVLAAPGTSSGLITLRSAPCCLPGPNESTDNTLCHLTTLLIGFPLSPTKEEMEEEEEEYKIR